MVVVVCVYLLFGRWVSEIFWCLVVWFTWFDSAVCASEFGCFGSAFCDVVWVVCFVIVLVGLVGADCDLFALVVV